MNRFFGTWVLTCLAAAAEQPAPPSSLTYRAIEPCSQQGAFLVIDHSGLEDACVPAGRGVVLRPRCKDTFTLEIKPGKDRCKRHDQADARQPWQPAHGR